jgi:hypothetical protein
VSKPTTAEGYGAGLVIEARRLCLHVATILGDLLDDVVVVGGWARRCSRVSGRGLRFD